MKKKTTVQRKTSPTAEQTSAAPESLAAVTVVYVDGNSVAAMAVSRHGEGYRVEALEHLEVDRLLEVIKRLRHPIFMDLNFCLMPEKELIQQYFQRFISKPAFSHPTVCLLGAEKVVPTALAGEASEAARNDRRAKLFSTTMPVNPYEYPAVVLLHDEAAPAGQMVTELQRMRLADLVQSNSITQPFSDRLLGFCSGIDAARRVVERLPMEDEGQQVMLCDIGKLRTLYARQDQRGVMTFNPIPVGLARDDTHYFRSIAPEMDKLRSLQATIGNLLFPPEATPSPLFSLTASSPQVDCTRLALQVSRYALRAFNTEGQPGLGEPEPVRYLTGRGSRLPGMREYIEKKTNAEFRRLDRRPLDGVSLAKGLRWGDVADNVLLLGAALEAFRLDSLGRNLINAKYKAPPMKNRRCSIADLRDDVSYVFEHGVE